MLEKVKGALNVRTEDDLEQKDLDVDHFNMGLDGENLRAGSMTVSGPSNAKKFSFE